MLNSSLYVVQPTHLLHLAVFKMESYVLHLSLSVDISLYSLVDTYLFTVNSGFFTSFGLSFRVNISRVLFHYYV